MTALDLLNQPVNRPLDGRVRRASGAEQRRPRSVAGTPSPRCTAKLVPWRRMKYVRRCRASIGIQGSVEYSQSSVVEELRRGELQSLHKKVEK